MFCHFIDNSPSIVKEELEGCLIKSAEFTQDKKRLKLTLEKDGIEKELKITINETQEWLWLFLTEG
jgi:hypothetical protein